LENKDKYASKDEIGLAVFKAFLEFLLVVLVLELQPAILLRVLLIGFSLVQTVIYDAHK